MRKFNEILKLFALGIVFVLNSCQEELYDDAIYRNNKIVMKRVSLKNDSLRMNYNLMKAVNQVKQKSRLTENILGRMVYDSINNFYFDDEKGVLIEKDGKESYTFPIKRITGTETKLENIIFDENETGTYETYFSKYNFTEKQMDSMTDLEIKTETPIITNESFSRVQVCLVRKDFVCYPSHQGDLVGAGVGTTICTWVTTILGCEGSGGGGGGNPNNNGNDGGGATNNGGPKDITTTPVGGSSGGDPCKKIKAQNDKVPAIKQALVALSGTTSQSHENGVFADNTATATSANPVQNIPNTSTNGASININMNPTNPYIMIAHTHDATGPAGNGTYSIFSWDDLTTINALIQNNHINPNNFVFYVITADGTTYAMTVDNASNLSNFFYNPANVPGTPIEPERFQNMQRMFDKYYNTKTNGLIQVNTNPTNDKNSFMQFIKDAKLGISLFEVDSTFSSYTKLSIASNGTVSGAPCN